MGASFEIRVDNLDEVKRTMMDEAIKALEECGLVAEGYAKAMCPVDTGNLRNSITHKVVPDELACYIGSNVEYAPYIEFGTGIHYAGGRRTPWVYKDSKGEFHRTSGQRAQPFIRPAVADHLAEYQKIINNELKK